MADKQRQIIAIGGGFYRDAENLALEKYVTQQTGVESPRVAFVPTASGEPDHYLSSFYAAFIALVKTGADFTTSLVPVGNGEFLAAKAAK